MRGLTLTLLRRVPRLVHGLDQPALEICASTWHPRVSVLCDGDPSRSALALTATAHAHDWQVTWTGGMGFQGHWGGPRQTTGRGAGGCRQQQGEQQRGSEPTDEVIPISHQAEIMKWGPPRDSGSCLRGEAPGWWGSGVEVRIEGRVRVGVRG